MAKISFATNKSLHKETRPHDYLYDPTFTVPTAKDFYKHVMVANLRCAQYEISPVFENMFSSLSTQPSHQLAVRKGARMPKNIACDWPGPKQTDFSTTLAPQKWTRADLQLCYKSPVIKITPDILPKREVQSRRDDKSEDQSEIKTRKSNKLVQTVYRESSAQTKPRQPKNIVVPEGTDPEILKIQFLRDNLPAGMHEIELIKRARKKREWESLLPEEMDKINLDKRRKIIEAIETDQWAFREKEIMDIQNLRMQLLENMLQEILNETANRTELKLKRIAKRLNKSKEEKLLKIKKYQDKELRRLEREYKGGSQKYHKIPVIEEYKDYSSEVYAPLMRYGEHPKRKHEIIDTDQYRNHLIDIEYQSTIPSWIYKATDDLSKPKLKGRHLCIRETKWTEPVLKQLHEDLKNLRNITKAKCSLRKKIFKVEVHYETMEVFGERDPKEQLSEAVLFLQNVIRGRCIQSSIYEGRDRCRELITELQNTFPLQAQHARNIHEDRIKIMDQQRKQDVANIKAENMNELLGELQGTVVGTLLDFLNKEYRRLLDERKCHALALLHERERRDKEAAEAGRRQQEERRREEHDEIFKQVVKVHQDTVDLYLQDIITEGIDAVSDEQAKQYVQMIAKELNKEQEELAVKHKTQLPSQSDMEKQEIIANMVHHFMIPEVQRTMDRQQLKQKQQQYLTEAHNMIYNPTETYCKKLPDDELSVYLGGKTNVDDISCACDAMATCDPRFIRTDADKFHFQK